MNILTNFYKTKLAIIKILIISIMALFVTSCAPKLNNPMNPFDSGFLLAQILLCSVNDARCSDGTGGDSESGNVKFIATGLNGQIWISSDGSADSWTDGNSGVTNSLSATAYDGTKFVSVGNSGQVCTSADASPGSWTCFIMAGAGAINFNNIIFANNLFVAVGNGGNIWSSATGDTGSWVDNVTGSGNNLRGIAYDGSNFVVVGDNNTNCTSATAGVGNWTPCGTLGAFGATGFYSVAFGAGVFTAVSISGGAIMTVQSANGALASFIDSDGGATGVLRDIVFADGKFVAVGNAGAVRWSTDGNPPWNDSSPGGPNHLTGISYGQGNFVAVGFNGQTWRSPDGITWTDTSPDPGGNSLIKVLAIP